MTFKMQQVLRTNRPLRGNDNVAIPANVRVVVMNQPDAETVRVKVMDPSYPQFKKMRLKAKPDYFVTTHRGRPKKAVAETPKVETPKAPKAKK